MNALTPAAPDQHPRRPRGRPNAEDLVALEARLMSVSSDLFFRHGYGATTMAEVARVARVSKTTLYSRFPSKEALFRAIVASQYENWEQRVIEAQLDGCDSLEDLMLTFGRIAARLSQTPGITDLNRLMFSESGRFPELAEAAAVRAQRMLEFLARYISAFAERDNLPCRDPIGAARLFQNLMNGWYCTSILTNRTPSQAECEDWVGKAVQAFMASRPCW